MIDGFDQLVKNDKVTYENITKIVIGQGVTMQLVIFYIIPISKNIIKWLL